MDDDKLRHFLKFLSGDQRAEAERKYAADSALPKPRERRQVRPDPRYGAALADRRLDARPKPAPKAARADGDITGQWLQGLGKRKPQLDVKRNDSSPTSRLHAFLDSGGFELEDTGAFAPAKASKFNPYDRG